MVNVFSQFLSKIIEISQRKTNLVMAESKIMKKSIIFQVSCHRLYRWNNSWENFSKIFLSGDSDTVNSLKSKGDYEAKLL